MPSPRPSPLTEDFFQYILFIHASPCSSTLPSSYQSTTYAGTSSTLLDPYTGKQIALSSTNVLAADNILSAVINDSVSMTNLRANNKSLQHATTMTCGLKAAPPPVSRPIDPDVPSLLTLPGEIRNAIYEAPLHIRRTNHSSSRSMYYSLSRLYL
jgi:hypothetical protein